MQHWCIDNRSGKGTKCPEEKSVAVTLSSQWGLNPELRRERSTNNVLRHDKSCRVPIQLKWTTAEVIIISNRGVFAAQNCKDMPFGNEIQLYVSPFVRKQTTEKSRSGY